MYILSFMKTIKIVSESETTSGWNWSWNWNWNWNWNAPVKNAKFYQINKIVLILNIEKLIWISYNYSIRYIIRYTMIYKSIAMNTEIPKVTKCQHCRVYFLDKNLHCTNMMSEVPPRTSVCRECHEHVIGSLMWN